MRLFKNRNFVYPVLGLIFILVLWGFSKISGGVSANAAAAPPPAYKAKMVCFAPANFIEPTDRNRIITKLCEYHVEKNDHYARICFASHAVDYQSATTFAVPCVDYDAIKKITGN